MSTPRDDDALSWDGDDDPTLTTGADAAAERHAPAPSTRAGRPSAAARDAAEDESALPAGFTAVGKGSDTVAASEGDRAVLGNAALVAIGMFAAAFILFAVGWLIAGLRLQAVGALPVSEVTLVALTIAAAAAPLVWFIAVYALTLRARTWVRFVWLVAGLVLLVPWPFVATGALA